MKSEDLTIKAQIRMVNEKSITRKMRLIAWIAKILKTNVEFEVRIYTEKPKNV